MFKMIPMLALVLLDIMAPAQTLPALTPNHRVLLLFASSAQDAQLQDQLELLKHHAAELKDRDLLIVPLLVDTIPTPANALRLLSSSSISRTEQDTLRIRYHVPSSHFTVLLLGKDGDEKLRQQTPISFARLKETIDAMPMRQQEVRDRLPRTKSGVPQDTTLHQREPH